MRFNISNLLKIKLKKSITSILMWLFLCISTHTFAQSITLTPPLKFTNLSTEQGLSQSYVFSIAQDNQGYIWLATEDGLNRYDGKNFVHYRHNINNKNSIADNFIRKVLVDNNNILWVGTNNGLSRYNRDLDNFDNFLADPTDNNSLRDNVIWEIYQNNDNQILVSTAQGLQRYQTQTNNFKRIDLTSNNKPLTEVRTLFQDKKGNYWLGTYDSHIYLANDKLSYALTLNNTNKWNLKITAKSLFDIKEIDNQYWLATEQGVYVVNQNYQITKHLNQQNTLDLLSNEVRAISAFDDTHVWLGTRNGLNIVNILNDDIKSYQSALDNKQPKGISGNWIVTILKDKDGSMWLGNLATGVDKYNPMTSLFTHHLYHNKSDSFLINAISQTDDNKIWFSSDKLGLNYLLPQSNKLQHYKIAIENTIDVMKANKNDLWLSTYNNELYHFNTTTGALTKHPLWQKEANINNNFAFILLNNALWFINNEGKLSSYQIDKMQFSRFTPSLKNTDKLQAINKGANNTIWLTTAHNHIYHFNTNTKTFSQYKFKNKSDFRISEATNIVNKKHWLWLSSYSQGVLLINKNTGKATIFNEENGLINNNINAIVLDKHNNAWVSAANGISTIIPSQKSVLSFGKDYNLTDNELLRGSALASNDGSIYFGGLNGFQQFPPKIVLNQHQYVPMPVLNNLYIANKVVPIAVNKTITEEQKLTFSALEAQKNEGLQDKKTAAIFTLNKQLNQLTQLTLAYQQSPFTIEFISPNAKLPRQLQYRYKLTGLDTQWIEATTNNLRATYTNLNAGKYHFIVQAYDLHQPNFIQSKELIIKILPPWWLSTQAWSIYALIALLILMYILMQIRQSQQYHQQITQSEERLKLSLWGSGDEIWDWDISKQKIYSSNIWENLEFPQDGIRHLSTEQTQLQNTIIKPTNIPDGAALTHLSYQEILEQFKNYSNIHPNDFVRVYQTIEKYQQQKIDGKDAHFECTYRIKDNLGNWVWLLDRGKIVETDKQHIPTRITGTIKDISQLKNTEEQLKLFAQCIENISDAVVIYNRQFKVVEVNNSYQKITGIKKQDILNKPLYFPLYDESFTESVIKHVLSKGSWHGEIENKRNNSELYFIDLTLDIIRDENNNISNFVAVFSDITERKQNEAELRKLANSDTLTGLPNRSSFQVNQSHLVKGKIPHALLVFDLDNFKKINDSLGHELGDILLCRVAERILANVRKHDSIYRLGGDEFGLIIENTNDIHTITSIAKNILERIAEPLRIKNHELVLHSSIGIVLYPEDGASPQELLKNADTAMYHAKSHGGNQYQFFNDSMNKKVVQRLKVEHLIRYGLKHDYFSVFYQPKIEITTGRIAGMEALVRFEHPSKGIVSPVTFIPVSEETGQVIEIGEIVLRKSCIATKAWVDSGLFSGRIAVNLSAVQFTQPNLVAMIADILTETKLPAKYLELEITEGTVMDSPHKAIEIMQQIRNMGIHLSLDDFGTGYSSLAYLKKFPLNTLKIDKAFVDDIEHSVQGQNMVATIVTIAHNLGLQVVAEGVEHSQQLEFLSSLKCEQLQGYLYSKPLSEKDFYQYLRAHQITKKSTSFN